MAEAYRRTANGKKRSIGYLEFNEYAPLNLAALQMDLAEGAYRPGPFRHFTVYEPKPRQIAALSFRDRVAQHAVMAVVGPIFEATFLPRSYACRVGFGTHRGVRELQADLRRLDGGVYVLKTDFSKYFPSIDREILHSIIRRKISCRNTLGILEAMIPQTGFGLPIGSLTSQVFANVYGTEVDRFIHVNLGQKMWFRYMDDIVVLGRDAEELRLVKEKLEDFSRERLRLRFSKWSVQSAKRGINFLGYRIWPTHKLLRKQSVVKARRKLKILRDAGDLDALQSFVGAWSGHARWADTHNLVIDLKLRRPA